MIRNFVVVVILMSCGIYLFPQTEALKLNIESVAELALRNNLGVESERLKMDQKKWANYTSWNQFLPAMSISASISRPNKTDEDREITIEKGTLSTNGAPGTPAYYAPDDIDTDESLPEWYAGFNLNMQLTLNAAMFFNVYNTALDYRGGILSLETAKKRVVRDVKKSYYVMMMYQKNIELLRENIINAENRYKQAIANKQNGTATEYSVIASQVTLENLKISFAELENNYNTALIRFKQMIGISDKTVIEFDGTLDFAEREFDADLLIEKYIDNRLDIKALSISKSALGNMRNIYLSSLTPSIIIGFTADPKFQHDLTKQEDWYPNSDNDDKDWTDNWAQTNGALTFTASIPIGTYVPFSKEQMNIINNEFSIKQIKNAIAQARQAGEVEIKSEVMRLNKTAKSVKSIELTVKLAEKAFRMADDAYRLGTRELIDVENSENELNKANIMLLQEKINYISAFIDLQYAVNDDLNLINGGL